MRPAQLKMRQRCTGSVPALILSSALAILLPRCAGGERIRQFPFFDVDGWSCHGRGCNELRTLHGALVGQDTDETPW